jgi:mRNA interferase RelE/StbE
VAGQVLLARAATKELDALPQKTYTAIHRKLKELAADPHPTGSLKLDDGLYRIRIGEYRAVYSLSDDSQTVVILRVARRSEKTYRKL